MSIKIKIKTRKKFIILIFLLDDTQPNKMTIK